MKQLTILIFCLTINAIFAQKKGINLINKKSSDTTFIKENRRIRISTIDRKFIAGKFTILNDSAIIIKNKVFEINSILTIKKVSTLSAISNPIIKLIGSIFLLSSFALTTNASSSSGGYSGVTQEFGAFLALTSLPIIILSNTVNKHQVKKWKYEIIDKN